MPSTANQSVCSQKTDHTLIEENAMRSRNMISDFILTIFLLAVMLPTVSSAQEKKNNTNQSTSRSITTLAGPTTFRNGIGKSAMFNKPEGICSDGTNLYVADTQNKLIRQVNLSTGMVSTFAGSPNVEGFKDGVGQDARFSKPGAMVCFGGALYVVDNGEFGKSTIRKIVIATRKVMTLNGLNDTDSEGESLFRSFDGITNSKDTLFVLDRYSRTILAIDTANEQVSIFATIPGSLVENSDGAEDDIAYSDEAYPDGITCDGTSIYVSLNNQTIINDTHGSAIYKVEIASKKGQFLVHDLPSPSERHSFYPRALGYADGNIFMADAAELPITVLTLASKKRRVIPVVDSDKPGVSPTEPSHGQHKVAGFAFVGSKVFMMDMEDSTIKQLNLASGAFEVAFGQSTQLVQKDGVAQAARFLNPKTVASDGKYLYVIDGVTIRRVEISTGKTEYFAGLPMNQDWVEQSEGTTILKSASGIACDGKALYVSDSISSTICKIDLATRTLGIIAGTPENKGTNDWVGPAASFNEPTSLAYHEGKLYINDSGNQVIRQLDLATLQVSTIAGKPNSGYAADGKSDEVGFISPVGLCYNKGFLYVSDEKQLTIRRIDLSSKLVTTIAGYSGENYPLDGIGYMARFKDPGNIACNGESLFIVDGGSIRQLDITTGLVTTYRNLIDPSEPIQDQGSSKWIMASGLVFVGNQLYVCDNYNLAIQAVSP